MIKCSFCHKKIRFPDRVFYVDPYEPLHYCCVSRALALKRRIIEREKAEREQRKLDIFNEEND